MEKEILFRALSEYDKEMLIKTGEIKSLLYKPTTIQSRKTKKRKYYGLCIEGNGEYALDTVVGHVQGAKLRVETSCWISTTSSFDLACSEYAIPQSGNYNHFENRKNVIRIEVEKSKVLSDSSEIKKFRTAPITDDIFIDLRDGKLNGYYNDSMLSETFNPDMPGYNFVKEANRDIFGIKTRINGFSNFATASKEVLAYKEIKPELITSSYNPLQQDIVYGSSVMVDLTEELLEYAYSKLSIKQKEFFDLLYPSLVDGTNLTDILIQNYKFIYGDNIYEKYETLKRQKMELLNVVVGIINDKFNEYGLNIKRVVDDGILVHSLTRPMPLSKTSINDVIVLESHGELYKYSHKDKGYVSEKGKVLEKKILGKK